MKSVFTVPKNAKLRRGRKLFEAGFIMLFFLVAYQARLPAQTNERESEATVDSDHDGLSDALEQALLVQFVPSFMIGDHDCSNVPAEFEPGVKTPHPEAENGTIYGQVFPAQSNSAGAPLAEIHYYHLWRRDCGAHGHPLDTEHVAVLVRAQDVDLTHTNWRAEYWYAAAHENTVCDVSQIARASTLHAEDHGAKVWISPGKHASYLNETLCQRGCGADRCEHMVPLVRGPIINLGEPGQAMNDSVFIASNAWPLSVKMSSTNFPAAPVGRLEALPDTDIAWFSAGRHPAQQIISISSSVRDSAGRSIAEGGGNTSSTISLAGNSTGAALSTAKDSTGNALEKSFRHTKHGIGSAATDVGKALHLTPKTDDSQPH